jgi:hypothetical protein
MEKIRHIKIITTGVVQHIMQRNRSKSRLLILILAMAHLASYARAQWVQLGSMKENVLSLASYGPNLYAGVDFGGIYRTTDNGMMWSLQTQGLPYEDYYQRHYFYPAVYNLTPSGPTLYAGTNRGVFVSKDSGSTWTPQSIGITSQPIKGIVDFGTTLCAGSDGGGVFVSTDYGSSWKAYNVGLTNNTIRTIIRSGSDLFVGTGRQGFPSFTAGVFRSTDQGINWSSVSKDLGLNTNVVTRLALSGATLIAGTDGSGVYISTDNGSQWRAATNGITDPYIRSVAVYGTAIFAGTSGGGLYISTDFGSTWMRDNGGLINIQVSALMVMGKYIYAGTSGPDGSPGGKVFRRPLSDFVTSVRRAIEEIPNAFALHQNYPNPFNPSTTITFTIPWRSVVSLKIYDLFGREVATVVSEEMSSGNYSRTWNATKISSGIYFYRLQAGNLKETKILIILK